MGMNYTSQNALSIGMEKEKNVTVFSYKLFKSSNPKDMFQSW